MPPGSENIPVTEGVRNTAKIIRLMVQVLGAKNEYPIPGRNNGLPASRPGIIPRRRIARPDRGSPPPPTHLVLRSHARRQIAVHRRGRPRSYPPPPFLHLTPSPQSGARRIAALRAGDRGRRGPDACVMGCPAGILPPPHPRGGTCDQAVVASVLLQVAPPCRRGPSVPAGGAARPRSAERAGLGCRGRAAAGSSRKALPLRVRHGIRIGPSPIACRIRACRKGCRVPVHGPGTAVQVRNHQGPLRDDRRRQNPMRPAVL